MRAFGLCCLAIVLTGCSHYFRVDQQDFDRGSASSPQFERDNYECSTAAVVAENMVRGSDAIGAYNRHYRACMAKRGYGESGGVDTVFGLNG